MRSKVGIWHHWCEGLFTTTCGVRGSDLSGRSLAPALRQEDGLSESNASALPTAPSANPWRPGKSCFSPTRQAGLLDGRLLPPAIVFRRAGQFAVAFIDQWHGLPEPRDPSAVPFSGRPIGSTGQMAQRMGRSGCGRAATTEKVQRLGRELVELAERLAPSVM